MAARYTKPRFIVHRSRDKQFFASIRGKSGSKDFTTETYTRKAACFRVLRALFNLLGVMTPVRVLDETGKQPVEIEL